jgi:hypothetical protein
MNFAKTKNLDEIEDFTRYVSVRIDKKPEPAYYQLAEEDAKMLVTDYFMDEIIEQLIENGEASDDYKNDYHNGDEIFHETIVDRDYSTEEAIELLNDLRKFEEDDYGLCERLSWDRALATIAAYTYGNAVCEKWTELIAEINYIDMELAKIETANEITKKYNWQHETIPDDELYDLIEVEFGEEVNQLLRKNIEQEIKEICE